jgi:hypothetical protein
MNYSKEYTEKHIINGFLRKPIGSKDFLAERRQQISRYEIAWPKYDWYWLNLDVSNGHLTAFSSDCIAEMDTQYCLLLNKTLELK